MAVIVPCAGKSSRFPGMRPKYLLTMYDNQLMVEKAIAPYLFTEDIHIIILREHARKYDAEIALNKIYQDHLNVHIHILEEETSGPAETVYQIAKRISPNAPLFVKDCDSFFDSPVNYSNHVCVADLRSNLNVTNVAGKSFAVVNDQKMLVNIVEKTVVSNYICVGGYGFASASEFVMSFERLCNSSDTSEIFLSHVIKNILDNTSFEIEEVKDYVDVGTLKEYIEYNQSRPTIFCDLDGTVFYNQSRYFSNDYTAYPKPIQGAVDYLLDKEEKGSKIIFTTARPDSARDVTLEALHRCGFKDISILFNMPHAPRMIINDNSKTSPYPTAIALNVPRDDNDFWSKING